jgi:hypothetical protein
LQQPEVPRGERINDVRGFELSVRHEENSQPSFHGVRPMCKIRVERMAPLEALGKMSKKVEGKKKVKAVHWSRGD